MARKNKSLYQFAQQEAPETKLTIENLSDKEILKIKKIDEKKMHQHFSTMAEKLAKSSVYYRNWYPPELKDKFPYDLSMRMVEKMFPYAIGGPLLVDEPYDEAEHDICIKKKAVLEEYGYRYIIVGSEDEYPDLAIELEERDRNVLGYSRK